MVLTEKKVFTEKQGLLEKYSAYLKTGGFRFSAVPWLVISFIVSAAAGLLLAAGFDARIGAIAFLAGLDLLIGLPYIMAVRKIEAMEAEIADSLRQMSETLKAGGTYEYCLREMAQSSQGQMQQEMKRVLRKLEEGENFENSLRTLSEDIDSRTIRRVVTIIIDSVKSGAPLAEVLEEIAEDVRETKMIERERKSRTLMQAMFLVTAAAVVAPAIFGFVATMISVLFSASAATAPKETVEASVAASSTVYILMQAYLALMAGATSAMVSLMREGRLSKGMIYFPGILLAAFIFFSVSETASKMLFGGIA